MMRSNGANFYRMATDALAEMFFIEDAEGRLVWANKAASRVYSEATGGRQLRPGDVTREFFPPVIHDGGALVDEAQEFHRLALASGQIIENVIRGFKTVDGERWFRCRVVPMADPATNERCAVHCWTEVTDERRVAAELERHERYLRSAFEHGPLGMAVIESDGRFMDVNPAFCRLGGWDRDDLIGRATAAITHADDASADDVMRSQMIESGRESFQLEKRYVAADGSAIPVRVIVALVRTATGGHTFVTQCVDISAQKRVEAAQIEALRKERQLVAELREVERVRADFVATASHELRTPVVSLLGFLELMADELHGAGLEGSPAEFKTLIAAATRNGQRLQKLVDNLLTVAQIESGGMSRRSDPVSVAALLANVGEIMTVIAQQSAVQLNVEVDPSVGWVIGDAEQLERVLVNVVGNAVKFTPSGGSVGLVGRSCEHSADQVIFEVVDTGIGIPASEKERLFTRFFRSSTARDAAVGGTGLGLAIAAEIVDAHGGTISVTSEVGSGTTFTIQIPRAARRASARS